MCGISVIVGLEGRAAARGNDTDKKVIRTQLENSLTCLKHRGPDSNGAWISPDSRVGKLGPADLSFLIPSAFMLQPRIVVSIEAKINDERRVGLNITSKKTDLI